MVKELEERKAVFRTGSSVGGCMVGMGMDKRNPVYDVHVGECHDTSQVGDENSREKIMQVFTQVIRHSGCKDKIFMRCLRYDG